MITRICCIVLWTYLLVYVSVLGNICPECGSDHVIQLAGQSAPFCSTPINRSLRPDSEDDLDTAQSVQSVDKVRLTGPPLLPVSPPSLICPKVVQLQSHQFSFRWSQQDDHTEAMMSGTPVLGAAATTEDANFVTAQGSSFFTGDDQADISGLSYTTDSQSKEDLAGSYCYTSVAATPPEVRAHHAERAAPHGESSGISWTHTWASAP